MTPGWLLAAWDEAIAEDREWTALRRETVVYRGFRQPKRGRWRVEMPTLKMLLREPPSFATWPLVRSAVGLVFAVLPLLGHVLPWQLVCFLLPAAGIAVAMQQDAIPVVQST